MLRGKKLISKGNNVDKWLFCFVNFAAFILMFALSYLTPLYRDDLAIKQVVETSADIVKQFKFVYFNWMGRIVAMIFQYFFLRYDKIFYDLVNAVVYVALACTMYRYIAPERKWNSSVLAFVYLMLWFFLPTFGEEMLWLSGSVLYLWCLLIVMCFGVVYYRNYEKVGEGGQSLSAENEKFPILLSLGMFLFGILAGLSLEPTACALMVALFCFVVWSMRRKRKLLISEISGMVGAVIGFCILMFAPGNFVRAAVVAEENTAIKNIFLEYLFRIARETFYTVTYLSLPMGICIALICLATGVWKKRACFFVALGMISVYVMTFCNAFTTRILVTPLVLIVIGIGLAVKGVEKEVYSVLSNKKWGRISYRILLGTLILFALTQYTTGVLRMVQTGEPLYKEIGYLHQETAVSDGLMP